MQGVSFGSKLGNNEKEELPRLERNPVLAHHKGEHNQGEDLRSVGLGGGHSNLGPGVDVHATVRLAADGGPHGVGDTDDQRSTGLTISRVNAHKIYVPKVIKI